MIRQHSQRIIPPQRPDTALSLALKAAFERASCTCTHAREQINDGGRHG